MVGLGIYKELHQIPGLGPVWVPGMKALDKADRAVIIGFSMSDFDAMAQLQFAEVARARHQKGKPLPVTVIDIHADSPELQKRYQRVFSHVEFKKAGVESFDWSSLVAQS